MISEIRYFIESLKDYFSSTGSRLTFPLGPNTENAIMATLQEANKARMREFVQVVQSDRNVEAADRFFAPDFVNPDVLEILSTGRDEDKTRKFSDDREGDKALHRKMFQAFPDIKVTILDMAADGDKVWTFKQFEGTHKGAWLDIPPTGRKVSFLVIDIMTFRDGMIIDHQEVSEFFRVVEMLRQG